LRPSCWCCRRSTLAWALRSIRRHDTSGWALLGLTCQAPPAPSSVAPAEIRRGWRAPRPRPLGRRNRARRWRSTRTPEAWRCERRDRAAELLSLELCGECGELANLIKEGFSGSPAHNAPAQNGVLAGLLRASGRACAAGVLGSMCSNVHACAHPFIGHLLDIKPSRQNKLLISLALPRGLEPLFSP
jgi:hypothetical protein